MKAGIVENKMCCQVKISKPVCLREPNA